MAKKGGSPYPFILRLIAHLRNATYLVLALAAKISLQEDMVILTYHSVASSGDFYSVTPFAFKQQMEYLRNNYSVLPLSEISDFIRKKKRIPKKSVSITFDDGYQDFYTNAYPYLRKHRLPATVFVTTDYVDRVWPLSENGSTMLSWEQILEISGNGIEIGAHTVTHPNLQEKGLAEAKCEIIESKKIIEEHLNAKVRLFSYPFGRYTLQTVKIIRDCGFEGAVGGVGTVRKDLCPFVLNRVQIDSSISFLQFKTRLTKAVDWFREIEYAVRLLLRRRQD
jgi:peptidoglycan/xylan/chitin deacetylase (PgdA/CDA1 family)